MEGTIYKVQGTQGTSYGINYTDPLTGGQVRRIIRKARTEEQAQQALTIAMADALRGQLGIKSAPKPVPFTKMAEKYLEWSKSNKKSWARDSTSINALKKAFGRKLLSDITPWLVEQYKMKRKKKVAVGTINRELSCLSQIFKKAIFWKKAEINPVEKVKLFKEIIMPIEALTKDEVLSLIDNARGAVKPVARLLYHTGMRIKEALTLKWEYVFIDRGYLLVVDSKNGATEPVLLNDEAKALLEGLERRRGQYVFCRKDGRPYKRLYRGLCNAAKRAGVRLPKRKAWHIFRHTWATNTAQIPGCDTKTLMELGRWKDPIMPLRYTHPSNDHKRKILEGLPSLRSRDPEVPCRDSVSIAEI